MGEALGPASRSWQTAPCLSRATSLPEGLDGLDLGRAGQYWRCPRLPKCFRRIACTMGRTSLPLREQHLVLLALGEFTSRQDASRFLCIAPTASRDEVNRAAKTLRADLDRFFGDLFACPVLRRHLQNEVEDQWLEEEGCSALTIAWRKIGRLVLRGEVVEPTLWYTTASIELAAFDLLDMAHHVRAHIKVSFRIA